MSHNCDYICVGLRFLLALVVVSLGFLFFISLPIWALLPAVVTLGWSAGWMTRRLYDIHHHSRQMVTIPYIVVSENSLERMRELHRLGDG